MMSRWFVFVLSRLFPSGLLITLWQAFELYPTGCCHSSSYNKRADRLHYFLGSLPLRCIVRSTSSSTGMDIDHNSTYDPVSLIMYFQTG